MRKIGFMGGTFNPVHLGHVHLAKSLKEKAKLDEVLIIPANRPPHKDSAHLASNEDRLVMCRLAFEDLDGFSVSDLEYKLGGKSYTVHTVSALREEYPEDELFMILGGDMLLSFDTWFGYQKILEQAKILAAARNAGETETLIKKALELDPGQEKIRVVNVLAMPMSSTEVRQKIGRKEDVGKFLDGRVLKYIYEKNLYPGENE